MLVLRRGEQMKFSVQELKKHFDSPIEIHETLEMKEALLKRYNALIDMSEVFVSGLLIPSKKETLLHLQIKATLTIPSTRSLTPVLFPVNESIEEIYVTKEQLAESTLSKDQVTVVDNVIDLTEAVEDYLILSIPTQVLTEEELAGENYPKGDFWEVLSEEEYEKKKLEEQHIDPRLAKLGDLFKED